MRMTITTMTTIITTIATIITATASATPSAGCRATRITATTMPDGAGALLRLMTWLSPAFPVGGYSYSHGLEAAVDEGLLSDRDGLEGWISTLLEHGSIWNDAVLCAESWRRARSGGDVSELAELGEALAGSQERHIETMMQGAAFTDAAVAWPHETLASLPARSPYCVAVGAVAGAHGVALDPMLAAFLQALASNLCQAAIRLGVTGQAGAVATIAALEPLILTTASRAARSTLDDLGSSTVLSDIAAMRHEVQYSRLFRS
jgi:urease accessory protein